MVDCGLGICEVKSDLGSIKVYLFYCCLLNARHWAEEPDMLSLPLWGVSLVRDRNINPMITPRKKQQQPC